MNSIEYLVQDVLLAWIAIFAGALLAIAIISYRRTKNPKILYIAGGFALFFSKGIIMSIALYTGHMDVSSSFVIFLDLLIIIDLIILLLLYFAMFRK
ncbi:MAG: hypothetical protein JSV49_03920 [Thermoplasmata archaeon]|nr:MAG: hypothetical protein JSV49_03920 [Thermoplasmata archaeon]